MLKKSETVPARMLSSSQGFSWLNLMKAIGPGILVACAAIGGSHLVWSTRAGAEYGWSLVWLILLANLLKYPFFLYGQRYTAATGESLLAGYYRQGPVYVWIFLLINILTGTINIAGVGMLAGALLQGYGILSEFGVKQLTVGMLVLSTLVLLLGHYRLLDGVAKIVIILLSLSTVAAVIFAYSKGPVAPPDFVAPSPWNWASFAFLIYLLGWMPAPVDLSAWSSLWIFSREKQTGHFATVKETSIDFYLGYIVTVVLAVVFVALGALVMYGSGQTFDGSGIAFSKQLVSLYSANIGEWSHSLILTAAFLTMFSTTITCIDGYPRSLAACCSLLGDLSVERFRQINHAWVVVSVVISIVIVLYFTKTLIDLLSFAAAVSFLTFPILAYINLRVMQSDFVPEKQRPGPVLRVISWSGMAFFVLMSASYLYMLLFLDR